MIDGNSQVSYYLGVGSDGQHSNLTGYELMSNLEVHQYGGLSDPPISLDVVEIVTSISLTAVMLPQRPIYIDGSSNVNGLYDGSIITCSLDTNATTVINGVHGNLSPIVDLTNNYIYYDGNVIYGKLLTTQSDGEKPVDNGCVLKFCYFDTINNMVECSLPIGKYLYQPRLLYTFGFAKKRNLLTSAVNDGTLFSNGKSSNGLKGLINDTVLETGVLGFIDNKLYGTSDGYIKFVFENGLIYKALLPSVGTDVTVETDWVVISGGGGSSSSNVIEDTDWEDIDYLNNWADYDSVWQSGQWRVKNDQLKFRGLIHNTVPDDANKTIFILPEEVRPTTKRLTNIINDMNIPVRVQIDTTGEISIPLNPLTDASITFEFTIDL